VLVECSLPLNLLSSFNRSNNLVSQMRWFSSSSEIPKRMLNHRDDVLRLYRAFLRVAKVKKCVPLVRDEFRRQVARSGGGFSGNDALRFHDTAFRTGLMRLEEFKKVDSVGVWARQ
jgi:hypothetical protein